MERFKEGTPVGPDQSRSNILKSNKYLLCSEHHPKNGISAAKGGTQCPYDFFWSKEKGEAKVKSLVSKTSCLSSNNYSSSRKRMGVVHLLNAFQGQVWEKPTQKPKVKANSSRLSDGVKQ